MAILAIDPGNTESAYVVIDENMKPLEFGKIGNVVLNGLLIDIIKKYKVSYVAIEMVASYGMAVGKDVFETCVWIGRFTERTFQDAYKNDCAAIIIDYIYRKDVKMAICGSMKAKDSNIRQALIDQFGEVGTKKKPGWFYGFKSDIWSAYAVAVTYSKAV